MNDNVDHIHTAWGHVHSVIHQTCILFKESPFIIEDQEDRLLTSNEKYKKRKAREMDMKGEQPKKWFVYGQLPSYSPLVSYRLVLRTHAVSTDKRRFNDVPSTTLDRIIEVRRPMGTIAPIEYGITKDAFATCIRFFVRRLLRKKKEMNLYFKIKT